MVQYIKIWFIDRAKDCCIHLIQEDSQVKKRFPYVLYGNGARPEKKVDLHTQ